MDRRRRGDVPGAVGHERLHLPPPQRRVVRPRDRGDFVSRPFGDDEAGRSLLVRPARNPDVQIAGAEIKAFDGPDVQRAARVRGRLDLGGGERSVALDEQRRAGGRRR